MSADVYVCGAVLALGAAAVTWWAGFLAGRRYESGIWERWLEHQQEAQEATKARRGVRLKTMRIRR